MGDDSASGGNAQGTPTASAQEQFLQRIMPYLSTRVMLRVAQRLGVTELNGKRLDVPSKDAEALSPRVDQPVGSDPSDDENEPSVAANPVDERIVVAFSHHGDDCAYWVSGDSGVSWQGPNVVPLSQAGDFCSDPVVRFSRDGAYAYLAYMSVREDLSTSDIIVHRLGNWSCCPVSWSTSDGPAIGTSGGFLDKPWVDVHKFGGSSASALYLTFTFFVDSGPCEIWFGAWESYGTSSVTLQPVASSSGCGTGSDPVLQGSRPIGGPGDEVLVCWYNSEADGFLNGAFDIRCRRSPNKGQNWDPQVTAANNVAYEVPQWLCPSAPSYHRAWPAMFPALAVGPDGSAHIVFTRDPTLGAANAECGNVVYTRSPGPPYAVWSSLKTLASGSQFQGYATIVAQQRPLGGCNLHLAYYDHRFSPKSALNGLYDVFRRQSKNCGASWGRAVRVTDVSSMSDFIFIGDYIDTASTNRKAYVAWTDRGDILSIFDFEDDVFVDQWAP